MNRPNVKDNAASRRADLAAIHIGKKALFWTEEEYRDLLWTVCQARSSAELDFAGRKRFLDHMRACGFKGPAPKAQRAPLSPMQAKIWSLWQELADEGRVKERRMPAIDAFCKRYTGVDKMLWLNYQQEEQVVNHLKQWLKRPD